jgi:hypothetical protein
MGVALSVGLEPLPLDISQLLILHRARSRLTKGYHRPSDAVSQGDIQWPDGPGRQHQVS